MINKRRSADSREWVMDITEKQEISVSVVNRVWSLNPNELEILLCLKESLGKKTVKIKLACISSYKYSVPTTQPCQTKKISYEHTLGILQANIYFRPKVKGLGPNNTYKYKMIHQLESHCSTSLTRSSKVENLLKD